MNLYTIGFGKKSAKDFFSTLTTNDVKRVIDIRLNNTSQLAGYTKKSDLEYFLKTIANIDYLYLPEFAPTKQLLDDYKNKKITWLEYEDSYNNLLDKRQSLRQLDISIFNDSCLLCSEPTAKQCHRRLLAEFLANQISNLEVVHL